MPRKRPWSKGINDHVNELRMKRRKELREQQICTSCHSREVSYGFSKCVKCRQKDKKYYKKNREKVIDTVKQYTKNHLEENRVYHKNYMRKCRQKAIDHLGGKCVRCGFTDCRALQIDHVNGDGIHEKRRLGTYNAFLQWKEVVNDTTGKYQLLCANCNWIKRSENEEHLSRSKRHH